MEQSESPPTIEPPLRPLVTAIDNFFHWVHGKYCPGRSDLNAFRKTLGFDATSLSHWRKAEHTNKAAGKWLDAQIAATEKLLAALSYDGKHCRYLKKGEKCFVREASSWASYSETHTRTQADWISNSKKVIEATEEYLTYLYGLRDHANYLALQESTKGLGALVTLGMLKVPVPSQTKGLRELTFQNFTKSDDFDQMAVDFLRGSAPSPATAIHSAVQRQISAELLKISENFHTVMVHGPVADGTSTIIYQVAYAALSNGRRVLEVADPKALDDAILHDSWKDRPVIIFDDAYRLTKLPRWVTESFAGDSSVSLFLGTQSRRRAEIQSLFRTSGKPLHQVSVPKIKPGEAQPFIDLIADRKAASDGLEIEEIRSLFLNGLSQGRDQAGLWPAQYQATRGIMLDSRVRQLLSDLDPASQRVVSLIAFLGFLSHLANNIHFPRGTRLLLQRSIGHLGLNANSKGDCASALQRLGSALDGEFRHSFDGADLDQLENASFDLRHPRLAECLFRWCFGAKKERQGQRLFSKWDYYIAVIKAVAVEKSRPAAWGAYLLIHQMAMATDYDFKSGSNLRKHLTNEAYPCVGDRVLATIEVAEAAFGTVLVDDSRLWRRLNVTKASMLTHEGRPSSRDDEAKARTRLEAALVGAADERDYPVLLLAARIAQRLNQTTETGDWRALIELAERLGPGRPFGQRKASQEYLRLSLNDRRISGLDRLIETAERVNLIEDPGWNLERLDLLWRLLNWVRRTGSDKVHYLIPLASKNEGRFRSIKGIYVQMWSEMYRRERFDVAFRKSIQGSSNHKVNTIISNTLANWINDFDADKKSWPDDVMQFVSIACEDKAKWPSFMRSYKKYFPS